MFLWIFISLILFSFFVAAIVVSIKEDRKKDDLAPPTIDNYNKNNEEGNFRNSAFIKGNDYGSS